VEQTNWAEIADSGLYTVGMAARLLAAKPEKVRSWVEGYGHSKATPILIRQLPRVSGKTVLDCCRVPRTQIAVVAQSPTLFAHALFRAGR
jgi:hypothetical protein